MDTADKVNSIRTALKGTTPDYWGDQGQRVLALIDRGDDNEAIAQYEAWQGCISCVAENDAAWAGYGV